MKPLMCLAVACVVLLSGCPDNKMPKAPPKVPEPKAALAAPASWQALHLPARLQAPNARTQA